MTAMAASGSIAGPYPVDVEVDGPAPQGRLSVLLRLIFAIPSAIVVALLGVVSQIITLIAWFVILFTGKYPASMASFVENVMHWSVRTNGYAFLLTDKYPPFAMGPADYPIRLNLTTQLEGRNRVTVFFRIFMLIPHAIVLYLLTLAVEVVGFIAWLVALFTGSVPPGLHTFIAGWLRWSTRVSAYASLLVDDYPPFSLT